jgi:uncharacterized protein (TIGR03435 family)
MMAYNIADWQLSGAPAWLDSEGYDIIAKPERPANHDEIYSMVRTLLAERFKLAMHTETNELRLYALVLDKTGPKIQVNENGAPPRVSERPGHALAEGLLSQLAERTVIDKSGLTGLFDKRWRVLGQ